MLFDGSGPVSSTLSIDGANRNMASPNHHYFPYPIHQEGGGHHFPRQHILPAGSHAYIGGRSGHIDPYTSTEHVAGYPISSNFHRPHGVQSSGLYCYENNPGYDIYPTQGMPLTHDATPRSQIQDLYFTQINEPQEYSDLYDANEYTNSPPNLSLSSPSTFAYPRFQNVNGSGFPARHDQTEKYLRDNFGLSESVELNLYALPDISTSLKLPQVSAMISLAIWGSKAKKLTLRQIYDDIEDRYPALKARKDKPWQRSVRHKLSLKAMFVQAERPSNHSGKGHYWTIDVTREGNKRNPKRKGGRGVTEEECSDGFMSDTSSETGQSNHVGPSHSTTPSYASVSQQYLQQTRTPHPREHSVGQRYPQKSSGNVSRSPQSTFISYHNIPSTPGYTNHVGYDPSQQMGMQCISPSTTSGSSFEYPMEESARPVHMQRHRHTM